MKIEEYRGIRGLVCAELLTDEDANLTYDTPFKVAGTSQLVRTTETSSEAHYYDNVPAVVIDSTGADTVTVDVSAVDFDVLAKLTGQYYNEATGMFVEGERTPKYFAMGYITEKTDGTEVYVWRLKGKFNIPDSTHGTKNSGTDANGQQLVFTGINTNHKFASTSKTAKAINVDKSINNDVTETTFFQIVNTPDTITGTV